MELKTNLFDELLEKEKEFNSENSFNNSETKVLLEKNEANKISALRAFGLSDDYNKLLEEKEHRLERKESVDKYGKHIFHISEIKDIAIKYDLRFIRTCYYKGYFNEEFLDSVISFAEKNELRIGLGNDTWSGDGSNFYILATRDFIKKKNKDVNLLLFYKTGNVHYKLIHEQGKAISMYRLLKGFRRKSSFNRYIFVSSLLTLFFMPLFGITPLSFLNTFILSTILSIVTAFAFMNYNDGIHTTSNYYNINGWDNEKTHFYHNGY